MHTKEVWKDVKNYEGIYQVSNIGNVSGVERIDFKGRFRKRNLLKPSKDIKGYLRVVLSKMSKRKTIGVHQLVAIAFLNHTPCGMNIVVDHIDNDKINNNVLNLQLISNRKNSTKDRFRAKSTSDFIGVNWDKERQKWKSEISINGKNKFIGRFECEIAAAKAYNDKLKSL